MIRQAPLYRREAFEQGLRACGYEIHGTPRDAIRPDDVLLIWNRYGEGAIHAERFEAAGATVIVAENGYLGRDWRGEHWYALARRHHNGAGDWRPAGPERWDAWGVEFQPWRERGKEIVILATRGIGPQGIAEPHGWSARVYDQVRQLTEKPVRIRHHPGENSCVPLEVDLWEAECVITWGSGAALKALMMGIPVFYGFDRWIGGGAARFWDGTLEPVRPCRQPTFRRLAWSVWRTHELATGAPFARLLA